MLRTQIASGVISIFTWVSWGTLLYYFIAVVHCPFTLNVMYWKDLLSSIAFFKIVNLRAFCTPEHAVLVSLSSIL